MAAAGEAGHSRLLAVADRYRPAEGQSLLAVVGGCHQAVEAGCHWGAAFDHSGAVVAHLALTGPSCRVLGAVQQNQISAVGLGCKWLSPA